MKTTITLLIALMIATAAGTAVADSTTVPATPEKPKPDKIQWVGHDEGIARADAEGKHVLIDFYTGWCGFCKKMDATTFRDRRVIDYINDNFVSI